MIQPSAVGKRRSVCVLEESDIDGTDCYRVGDEEDGAEGFLDALEGVFWVFHGAEFPW
jgi:hypothetical protein